ncbi:MAG: TIGR03545 family protein [Planctomycetaceae bacterium]|nr:TIGR03545 family protein [Planctomycetaceae bacterium]
MRWTYVIPRLLIVVFIWAGLHFGMDPALRFSAIRTAQTLTGAKADVGELSTTLYPPRVTVSGVALASAGRPGTNLVEFETLEFRLSGDPLLRRQFVVEEGVVKGVRFGTLRGDDGQLEEEEEEPESTEPSWLAEQLKARGREWLNGLTEQIRSQLDPNVLETYRTGDEIYRKWDGRFQELSLEVKAMKPRVEDLRVRFRAARSGNTVEQIENYLQVAQQADTLVQDAQALRKEMTDITPEVRTDLMRLDQARKNDTEQIQQLVREFRPDAGEVAESVIGGPMYEQLHQLISWIQTVRSYASQLQQQTHPERGRGTDFEFPWLHPTPDFHLCKLTVSGDMRMDHEWVPFEAVVTDVTSDAPLLQRPAIVRFRLQGKKPLLLKVTYDATGETAITEIVGAYREAEPRMLNADAGRKATISAELDDIQWDARFTLIDDVIDGTVRLAGQLEKPVFAAQDPSLRHELVDAMNDVMSRITEVSAELRTTGPLKHPRVELHSPIGEEISEGVRLAFADQMNAAKEKLQAQAEEYAAEQLQRLTGRFRGEYERLMAEHGDTIRQVQEIQQLVASLRSGKVDAATVFQQVSNSNLISEKDRGKVNKVMDQANSFLNEAGVPGALPFAIPGQGASPGLGSLPGLSGQQRVIPGGAGSGSGGTGSGSAAPPSTGNAGSRPLLPSTLIPPNFAPPLLPPRKR